MELEDVARSYYSDYYDINGSDYFIKMMLINGCFTVEYFLRVHENVPGELESMVWVPSLIRYDILLLENQLPFLILNKIFDLLTALNPHPTVHTDFHSWILRSINSITAEEDANPQPPETVLHLLHLYHSFCLHTSRGEGEKRISIITSGGGDDNVTLKPTEVSNTNSNATVLQEAEVMCRKKKTSSLDVTFSKGKKVIPPLLIDSFTKSKFRNLIAFEQFYPYFDSVFCKNLTAYIGFMDCIINTPEQCCSMKRA
eukprot:TRINITY_DN5438_c0_g1_i1.p1 TRINITY_DN5438_c0_g1~~TRINITY_DN5438_c0_g1_i1.p1  ORF type:complete len:256 (-),score=25.77 TRINITY_DN5438_c0_g1_i1:799-1566(-)